MRLALLFPFLMVAPFLTADPGTANQRCTGKEIARESWLPNELPLALRRALNVIDIHTVGELEDRGLIQVERDLRTTLTEAFLLRKVLQRVGAKTQLSGRQAVLDQVWQWPATGLQTIPLVELSINPRTRAPLEKRGWLTLGALTGKGRSDILRLKSYGPYRLLELEDWLEFSGMPALLPATRPEDIAGYGLAVEARHKLRLSIAELVEVPHFNDLDSSGIRNGHQLINLTATELIDRVGEGEWRSVLQNLLSQGITTTWAAEFSQYPAIVERRRVKSLGWEEKRNVRVTVLDTDVRARDFLKRQRISTIGQLADYTRKSLREAKIRPDTLENLVAAAAEIGVLLRDE